MVHPVFFAGARVRQAILGIKISAGSVHPVGLLAHLRGDALVADPSDAATEAGRLEAAVELLGPATDRCQWLA